MLAAHVPARAGADWARLEGRAGEQAPASPALKNSVKRRTVAARASRLGAARGRERPNRSCEIAEAMNDGGGRREDDPRCDERGPAELCENAKRETENE